MAGSIKSLLLSLLLLVFAQMSSLGARVMIQEETTSAMITGFARDLNRQQQQEWMGWDDWEEAELEIDGAGEDFPQERPHSFYQARRDSVNRF